MIKIPIGKRNLSDGSLSLEAKHIAMLNEALGDIDLTPAEEKSLVWLCGWETSTLKHVISAFQKAEQSKK